MTTFPEPTGALLFDEVMSSLPPEWPDTTLQEQIRQRNAATGIKVVVLDDDPTGPQAVSDVFVLTEWSVEALRRELLEPRPLFFVLTNTRSFPTSKAVALHREIAANLATASRLTGVPTSLVSRGDSTLRGHFPDEVEALGQFDTMLVVPAFFEGGRYTIGDCQWVREGGELLPAAETPYARDLAFSYRSSNLRNWVIEKSRGRLAADTVDSISLGEIRRGGPEAVFEKLRTSRRHATISNAASYSDLEVLTCGLLLAQSHGLHIVVRSAASFVRTRAGNPSPTWEVANLAAQGRAGGLIVVGSHVPKSTAQLSHLTEQLRPRSVELRVPEIRSGNVQNEISRVAEEVNHALQNGESVVLFTSRQLSNLSALESLELGTTVTMALVNVVRRLIWMPSFLVAKGGWTASEIGTKALGVRRVYAPRPILPGIPMWLLGEETLFPGMPYVVFPGNVGGAETLTDVVSLLDRQMTLTRGGSGL